MTARADQLKRAREARDAWAEFVARMAAALAAAEDFAAELPAKAPNIAARSALRVTKAHAKDGVRWAKLALHQGEQMLRQAEIAIEAFD